MAQRCIPGIPKNQQAFDQVQVWYGWHLAAPLGLAAAPDHACQGPRILPEHTKPTCHPRDPEDLDRVEKMASMGSCG